MTLYVEILDAFLHLYTKLPPPDSYRIGDIDFLLVPGEGFGGLSHSRLREVALTTGKLEADELQC